MILTLIFTNCFPICQPVKCKIFSGSSVSAFETALLHNSWRQLYFSGTMKHIVFRIKLAQAWNEASVLCGSLTTGEANFERNDSWLYTSISFWLLSINRLRTRNHMLRKDTKSSSSVRKAAINLPGSKTTVTWLKLGNENKTYKLDLSTTVYF